MILTLSNIGHFLEDPFCFCAMPFVSQNPQAPFQRAPSAVPRLTSITANATAITELLIPYTDIHQRILVIG